MTKVLQADDDGIGRAAQMLRQGLLVAFGTETVYGLGADATNAATVAAIFLAKGRPHFNPLICHYSSLQKAMEHVVMDERARYIGQSFWPGPLTLVLPRRADCPVALLASAGLDTLAVRVPGHPAAMSLLRQVDRPVAAPSANQSGAVSPPTSEHVLASLQGRIAAVLDSGPCQIGLESTVLDLSGTLPTLLRPGGVTVEDLEARIGPIQRGTTSAAIDAPVTITGLPSPGLMASHYAPALPGWLNATQACDDAALLAFGPSPLAARCVFQLSEAGSLMEAAARLFEGLRWLDRQGALLGASRIAVMPVPWGGLGLAINDRLLRAAAPRQ